MSVMPVMSVIDNSPLGGQFCLKPFHERVYLFREPWGELSITDITGITDIQKFLRFQPSTPDNKHPKTLR
jgi:hypothetical protein